MLFIHVLLGLPDPRSVNGVNKVVHWLATTQVEMGNDVEVWSLTHEPIQATHDHVYRIASFKTTRSRFFLRSDLCNAIRELPDDCWVQLHSVYIPELGAIARKISSIGLRYGVTPHGGYLSAHYDTNILKRIQKWGYSKAWEDKMLKFASILHAVGSSEVEDLQARAPSASIVRIPNGYYLEEESGYNYHPREESIPYTVAYAGRLEKRQKGLDLLLLGFGMYRRMGGTISLVICGAGHDHEALRSLSRSEGTASYIKWTGALGASDLRRAICGAVAFVHTSRFEGLPTACLEAAGQAVPLMVSEETNLGGYLSARKAGWVYSPNTPAVIAETLFKIERTQPEERLNMGLSAKRLIYEELNWSNICVLFESAVREKMGATERPLL